MSLKWEPVNVGTLKYKIRFRYYVTKSGGHCRVTRLWWRPAEFIGKKLEWVSYNYLFRGHNHYQHWDWCWKCRAYNSLSWWIRNHLLFE